jgi:preprotein translocase subunit Sec61beta
MAKESKGTGFQSAAGLIRYFEEEKSKGPKIDPKMIIVLGIVAAIIVELMKVWWPVG